MGRSPTKNSCLARRDLHDLHDLQGLHFVRKRPLLDPLDLHFGGLIDGIADWFKRIGVYYGLWLKCSLLLQVVV